MPAILSPSPRLAPQLITLHPEWSSQEIQHVQGARPRSLAPFQTISSRSSLATPRLLSPIVLTEPPYVALNSKSPTPCGAALKRRAPSRVSRNSRRRRHLPRVDCPFDSRSRAATFDQLPWIAALEVPRSTNCDIADLSQIPVNEDPAAFSETTPASGPVRRRKTSLRSNPLGTGSDTSSQEVSSRGWFPLRNLADRPSSCPRTPPPRFPFDPSHITFHNLMPIFPHGINPGSPF